MEKSVTIHDIATKLQIDASTVSRALRGSNRVKLKTKVMVLNAAKEMGYSKNLFASSLRTGKGSTIGVIVPQIQRNFFSGVIHGIEEVLFKNGYNLIICQSNERLEREKENIEVLLSKRVDGIIISVSKETDNYDHLSKVIEANVPLVQFDRVINDLNTSTVVNDNYYGAYQATKHLIDQGYKNILHFRGPLNINIYSERLRGYKTALEDNDLTFDQKHVFAALNEQDGQTAATNLISQKITFDSIFSASDFSALGAIKYFNLQKMKAAVPIGIVGFANEPFTQIIQPSISSVDQEKEEMGRSCAHMILEQLSTDEAVRTTKTLLLRPRLIIRESSIK